MSTLEILRAEVRERRLPLGLIISATVDSHQSELSFASTETRDNFLRRLANNGGTYIIISQ